MSYHSILEHAIDKMQHAQIVEINRLNAQRQRVYNDRIDPRRHLNDVDFKKHFRFNKQTVTWLAESLALERANDRGRPLTPIQSVCLTLNHFGGGQFNRVSAYCGNSSASATWRAIERVRDALCERAHEYIVMPTVAEMRATADRMFERYHLPNFAYGVDGTFIRYEELPRGLPVGPGLPEQQNFITRKRFPGINAMVIGNDRKLICALDVDWHGAAHDARVWKESLVRPVIEGQRQFYLAGDSAYPISDVLIKPYSNADALDDRRKKLFNARLCGLRTIMTENIFGIWKRRFPILKNMRCHYENAKKIIIATAVLHNIGILLSDDWDDDDEEDHEPADLPEYVIVEDHVGNNTIRERGQIVRETLCRTMPPRGRRE